VRLLNLGILTVYKTIYTAVDEIQKSWGKCLKELVGAKGFEPSTSWSRTKYPNPINALFGVAYGTRNVVSPLLVVRKLSAPQRPET
jgi:hypothetical protein